MLIHALNFNNNRILVNLMPNDLYHLTVNGVLRATNRSVEPLLMLADSIYVDLEWEAFMADMDAQHNDNTQANYDARGQANLF